MKAPVMQIWKVASELWIERNMPYMLCLVGGNFISRTIKFRSAKEVAENGFWRKP